MTNQIKVTDEMVAKATAAFRASGGDDNVCLRAALEAALAGETFSVGEEVTAHGSVTGIILSIVGDEALISWSCRGKSTNKLSELDHIDEAHSVSAAHAA
jgi:hypothetical protein